MPKSRVVRGHPKYFVVLHRAVNLGDAVSVDELRCSMRVLETLEKALDPEGKHEDIDWVDPALIKTKAEWDAAQKVVDASGRPVVRQNSRWDPSAAVEATLSDDEFLRARACFDRMVRGAKGADSRTLLALLSMLDSAKEVS